MISRREVLNFHISGSIRQRERFKRENVQSFKLLFQMKFVLMRQTGRIGQNSLCERIVINTSDASCVITDSFDDFATASFEFSYH